MLSLRSLDITNFNYLSLLSFYCYQFLQNLVTHHSIFKNVPIFTSVDHFLVVLEYCSWYQNFRLRGTPCFLIKEQWEIVTWFSFFFLERNDFLKTFQTFEMFRKLVSSASHKFFNFEILGRNWKFYKNVFEKIYEWKTLNILVFVKKTHLLPFRYRHFIFT